MLIFYNKIFQLQPSVGIQVTWSGDDAVTQRQGYGFGRDGEVIIAGVSR
jgi:hypothetical protein